MRKCLFFLAIIPLLSFGQLKKEVLFIGNSYTYYNDLPNLVKEIALSFGDTLIHESSTPGGYSFNAHSTNSQTLNKISQQQWDYIVLQAQSQEPSLSPGYVNTNVLPAAQILIDAIQSNSLCIEPLFFMTWGRKFGDASNCVAYPPVCTYLGMQERLRTRYLDMTFLHDASCSPVGMAWEKSIAIDSTLNLYSSDNSHPSIYGSYLAACTFYASIFKKSAVGSSFWPNAIDSVTAYSLQQIGSSTVLDSLVVWNIFNADFGFQQYNDSISFTNLSSNYESVLWNFGDGTTSIDENPTHKYALNGSYTVILTTITNAACIQDTQTVSITVNISTAIEDVNSNKELISITDILGRKANKSKNTPLLYRFSDGTLEKRIVLD
jgi:PKD repeat protein